MRRPLVLAACLMVAVPALAAAAPTEIPIDRVSLPAGKSVHLKFPVGDLRVEASTGSKVELEITARCKGWGQDDCEDRARRIHVESDDSGGRTDLEVKGYPKFHAGDFNLRGVLRVPANLDLDLEMGVGDLRVADVEGDLHVELGVGNAEIRAASRAIRSVDVAAGVGDADVIAGGSHVRRHGFVGSTASWEEGRGRSEVRLHVGVGDATVRVD
jgi:hypothetical protein